MQDDLCVVIVGNVRKPVGKRPRIVLIPEARDIKPNAARAWVQGDVITKNVLVWVHWSMLSRSVLGSVSTMVRVIVLAVLLTVTTGTTGTTAPAIDYRVEACPWLQIWIKNTVEDIPNMQKILTDQQILRIKGETGEESIERVERFERAIRARIQEAANYATIYSAICKD